jgi:branched-chain amino acid transport system substrate-binding protein
MEIYKDLQVVVFTPTSSEVSISQKGYRNFFRVNANDTVQAEVDARFLVENLKSRRVVLVHNDTAYGVGLRDAMTQALSKLGAEVTATIQVAEGQESYEREVAQVQQANPDAIFYAGYEIEAPYLRYAVVQAGIKAHFLASDGAFLAATIDESDGTAEGMYVSGFAPSPEQAVDKAWIDAYRQVEARNPDTYSINGYSALEVLADGAIKASSFDASRVSEAIRTLTVKTPMGQLAFESNGDVRDATIYIFQVKNDSFVQVFP